MYVTINARTLAALAIAPSTDKFRYYLQGVHFEPGAAVATDGHILTAAELDYSGPHVILPVSVKLRAALKGKKADTATYADGLWTVRTVTGATLHIEEATPIDGTFPGWRNVVPRDVSLSGDSATYAGPLLARVADTAKLLEAGPTRITGPHDGPAVVRYGQRDDVFSVIMPIREDAAPFVAGAPFWAFQQQEEAAQ